MLITSNISILILPVVGFLAAVVFADASVSPQSDEKKGGWRLSESPSEYLREHAPNPVEWWGWGEEAFERARELDRPVFLSIGYSSCHWCHVMRRESFSDEIIAAFLNQNYICIKVDREDHPHVDDAYMDAVRAMTGRGGWPLSVFLTADKKPFYGGTYFPPRSRGGRSGFMELIRGISQTWETDRLKLLTQSEGILEFLLKRTTRRFEGARPETWLQSALDRSTQTFDATEGGFGSAPKFPAPRLLEYLIAAAQLDDQPRAREMAIFTLRKMRDGGIYDQIGGGFHRYSVDRLWAVPHFEKMLYSQGLLGETYLEAFRMTGEEDLAVTARDILDAMLTSFITEDGTFAASWDADSGGDEGSFYVWNPKEVNELVGEEEGKILCEYFGVTERGNFEGGESVASRKASIPELVKRHSQPKQRIELIISEGRAKMLTERETRIAPKRDDKIVLGWNALAVSALARGAVILGEDRYRAAAVRAMAVLSSRLVTPEGFVRRISEGHAEHPARLTDAALFLKASLDVYEATLDSTFFELATTTLAAIHRDFGPIGESGGFFSAPKGADVLLGRRQDYLDSAIPSGNATIARCLFRMYGLSGEGSQLELAEKITAAGVLSAGNYPTGSPEFLLAVLAQRSPFPELAVAGDPRDPRTIALLRVAQKGSQPFAVWALRPSGEAGKVAAGRIPLLEGREAEGNRPTAWLCVNQVCEAPTSDPAALKKSFESAWRSGSGVEPVGPPPVPEGGEEQ
ncbi:MAG TPA: thioredoxin domain-containing protein [Planctomycetes bacterium]|nr:thioredoxin domain-containing protein [Planctomycetota bacterium]HIN80350.1 thioredoxin domain-containing protein [Planctomycetota bacterium]